ncbi:YitT family protein [Bacillus sp. FJAT-49736]|uniref:YitT family protein n=1 Tax=Bacillus sp. FJAT-49736 TaxID=2833582 RepID=UPI001BCA5E57|nr:YitT family protein [Bacillus sp. FJAT-49736]
MSGERTIQKVGQIILGSILLSIGVNGFLIPHHLLDGGLMGIALITYYFFSIPTAVSMICLSIPLYIFAFFYYRRYFYNSLFGLVFCSFFLDLFTFLSNRIHFPIFISALIGGALIGIGAGLILAAGVAGDGLDLFAQMVGAFSSINVGIIIFMLDTIVLLLGMNFLGLSIFLYSLLATITVGFFTSLLTIRYI